MQRTDVLVGPVLQGVYDALTTGASAITAFVVGRGERPKDSTGKHILPPYAVMFMFPGGDQDGPLNDSMADAVFRVRIAGAGKTSTEALNVSDACTKRMHKENIKITGRKVRRVTKLTSNDGEDRDDDVATPLFFHNTIWEIDTTPA
jgi:hypothetical protein